jgi:D-3-phosphoglycerate dehydrogenase
MRRLFHLLLLVLMPCLAAAWGFSGFLACPTSSLLRKSAVQPGRARACRAKRAASARSIELPLRFRAQAPEHGSGLKILLADKLDSAVEEGLVSMGHSIDVQPDLRGDTLSVALGASPHDVLVVRSTKVNADAIDKAMGLKLIVRAGAGVDNIDLSAARARKVAVANCAGANAAAVAELTFGLMIAADRQIPQQTADLKRNLWRKGHYGDTAAVPAPRGLRGRTLGLVGFGRIAREVAALGQAFGMEVAAWTRHGVPPTPGVAACGTLAELAARADVVCVHAAAPEPLIGEEFLASLPSGAILVNTARGSAARTPAV